MQNILNILKISKKPFSNGSSSSSFRTNEKKIEQNDPPVFLLSSEPIWRISTIQTLHLWEVAAVAAAATNAPGAERAASVCHQVKHPNTYGRVGTAAALQHHFGRREPTQTCGFGMVVVVGGRWGF